MPRKLLSTSGLALVLLATGGCAATGTFFDPTAEIKAAVAEALDDLANQPALHVTGSLYLKAGVERAEEYEATVLSDGTAWAEFEIADAGSGRLISVEGGVHINSDDGVWDRSESGTATILSEKWLRVPSDEWHDPGSLFRPDRFAELLRVELADHDSLEIPTPTTETFDGIEVYRVSHEEGSLLVTTQEPHRFASIDDIALRTEDPVTSALSIGSATVQTATAKHIENLSSHILTALPEMEQPYSITGEPTASQEDFEIRTCVYNVGCNLAGEVTGEANEDDPYTDKLILIFQGEVYDKKSDELLATCEKSRSVASGTEVTLSCTAETPSGYTGRVYAWGSVGAIGQYAYDTEAAIEYVTQAFADVTA